MQSESKVQKLKSYVFDAPGITSFIGLFFGLSVLGVSRVDPTNTDWIISGDRLSAQIIWNYFRESERFQWPLNLISSYGEGWSNYGHGSNILLSLPLKYFSPLLPDNFQFLGIWLVLSCALQGYFIAKILGQFSASSLQVILLSCNFFVFPIFLLRWGLMGHPQLAAQWLLLCGFYLFFEENVNLKRWALLLFVVFLVDPYITAMLIVVFYSALVGSKTSLKWNDWFAHFAKSTLLIALISTIMLYLQGYFHLPSGVSGSGFFRFSTTTFVNPRLSDQTAFSYFFNLLDNRANTYLEMGNAESFLYLGLGFILFGLLLFFGRFDKIAKRSRQLLLILFFSCVLMFLVGLSNKVSLLGREFVYWWPSELTQLRQIFRSSTRFGWPLAYFISLLVCIRILILDKSSRLKLALITALLLVNVIDLSPLVVESYKEFREDGTQELQLREELVDVLVNYSSIHLFPVFDLQVDNEGTNNSEEIWRESGRWQDVMLAASKLNLTSNFAYVSRPVGEIVKAENRSLMSRFQNGDLRRGELFIFITEDDALFAIQSAPIEAVLVTVGELFFVGVPK